MTMGRQLTLQEKIAVDTLVRLWRHVDVRPSMNDCWYPCYVQMGTALKKIARCIKTLPNTPDRLKKFLLTKRLREYLHMNAQNFYDDFEDHPSEYLEEFISHSGQVLFFMEA